MEYPTLKKFDSSLPFSQRQTHTDKYIEAACDCIISSYCSRDGYYDSDYDFNYYNDYMLDTLLCGYEAV